MSIMCIWHNNALVLTGSWHAYVLFAAGKTIGMATAVDLAAQQHVCICICSDYGVL